MRRDLIIFLSLIIFISILGCSKEEYDSDPNNNILNGQTVITEEDLENEEKNMNSNTNKFDVNSENTNKELISVDDFLEMYNLSDAGIPEDYVEKYIDSYEYKKDELENSKYNLGAVLQSDYEQGEVFGYSMDTRFHLSDAMEDDRVSDECLSEAEYIFIEFSRSMKQSDACTFELMAIDFKHMIICYGGDRSNYSDGEGILSAKLSKEDADNIREEIKKHINFDANEDRKINQEDYSFDLWLFVEGNQFTYLRGADKDEEGFPGFDDYWKELYLKYFGKEYSFPY